MYGIEDLGDDIVESIENELRYEPWVFLYEKPYMERVGGTFSDVWEPYIVYTSGVGLKGIKLPTHIEVRHYGVTTEPGEEYINVDETDEIARIVLKEVLRRLKNKYDIKCGVDEWSSSGEWSAEERLESTNGFVIGKTNKFEYQVSSEYFARERWIKKCNKYELELLDEWR